MPVTLTVKSELRRPYYAGHRSSYLDPISESEEDYDPITDRELEAYARLADIDAPNRPPPPRPLRSADAAAMTQELDQMAAAKEEDLKASRPAMHTRNTSDTLKPADDYLTAGGSFSGLTTPGTPGTPGLTRTSSMSDAGSFEPFANDNFPPVDRLSMFDILENLALPQRLERMQDAIHNNAEKLRRQRQKLSARALSSKNVLVDEWRKRVKVAPEERLDKYRRRVRHSVERMSKRWNDAKTVTLMEKISFVTAVLNIFVSAYMIGAYPQYFHYWYTGQLM